MGNQADSKLQTNNEDLQVSRKTLKKEKEAARKQLKIDNKAEKERVKRAQKERIHELKKQKIAAKKKGTKKQIENSSVKQGNVIYQNGTQHNSTQQNGTQHNSTQQNGTQPNGILQNGTIQSEPYSSDTSQHSTHQNGTSQNDALQSNILHNGTVQTNFQKNGLDHNGNDKNSLSSHDSLKEMAERSFTHGDGTALGAADFHSKMGNGKPAGGSDLDELLAEARSRINSTYSGQANSNYSPRLTSSARDFQTDKYLAQKDGEQYLAGLLTEERKRCNKHRENYNTLKIEHRKLQAELLDLQATVKQITLEKTELHNQHAKETAVLENELATLRQNNKDLQSQIPGRGRVEALKSKMISDVEKPFRERLEQTEQDNERLRGDNSKLRQDFTFLKSEFEHALSSHKSILSDLKLQHEAEVNNLIHDKDDLVKRLQQDTGGEWERVHTLQRENATLNLRVKSLLVELEELRSQRERVGLESDHVQRLQTKQMTEFQANTRGLQMERDTLRKQCDHQAKEITTLMDTQTDLTKRLHEEEQRSAAMRNALDSAHHESSLQLTQAKLESVKSVGVIERQRDSLHGQVEDLKCRLETLQTVMKQQESALLEKERECADRISHVREEEFQKLSSLNQERQNLESRLQTAERQKLDIEEKIHREQLRHEQHLRESQSAKEQAERELVAFRGKIHNQTQLQSDVDFERSRSADLRNHVMRLEAENQSLQASENELNDLINQLRRNLAACNEEIRRVREKEHTLQNAADKVLAQHKSVWSDERTELKTRLEQLGSQINVMRENNSRESAEYSKKKQIYTKLIDKLRRKLEIAEAEREQFRLKVESSKGYVPSEIVHGLKKELRDLKGRHREYRHILQSGEVSHVPIGNRSFATASVHTANFDISPDHTQDLPEMTSILKRLAKLDRSQQKQMSDLGLSSSPMVSPIGLDYSSDS